MAIKRIFATQDTSITSFDPSVPDVDPRYSNIGASEILDMYKWDSHRSEVLIRFPQDELSSVPASASVFLRLANAQHSSSVPSGYTVEIRPLEQEWVEGDGLDMDRYTDVGVCSWAYATTNTTWSLGTGTLSGTFFFNTGLEDLFAEVTWLTGVMGYGLDIFVDPFAAGNFYIKKFHSRQSHFPNKRPYLEARWTDWTGSLTTTQAFCVTSGVFSGTVWPASMAPNFGSGSGFLSTLYSSEVDPTGSARFCLYNLRPIYDSSEVVKLNLWSQRNDWDPATIPTSSFSSNSTVFTKMYYRVVDVVTNELVIPFGTGSKQETRLSYNDLGNYFEFRMANLSTGSLYRFDFLYESPTGSGNWSLVTGDAFKFRTTSVNDG